MRIKYFFAETVTNLRRNFLMSVAAISTVAISLLLLAGVQVLQLIVHNVTLSWEAKVEISAYLRDDATEGEIQSLQQQVTGYPEVEEIFYVSKDEAFNEFRARYRNQPEFYENLPRDALPASLRIKLTDASHTEEVAQRIQGAPGISDIKFGGEIIKRLLQVNSLLRTITLAMSVMLMLAAAALIANAIRLGIYARREEIGIMKLVGATNWFIRVPFMLEGVLAALLGALIAGGIVLLGNVFLFTRIGDWVPFLGPVFSFSSGEVMGVIVMLGAVAALVGLVGSVLALRRFLEV